ALVALRATVDGALRSPLVRRALPGGFAQRMDQLARAEQGHTALDPLERLADHRLHSDHRLWPADQRVRLWPGRSADSRRLDRGRDAGGLPLRTWQARLVPASMPGE